MKTLKHHTILYDAVCPMCNAYTSAFVKTGMLDEQGRESYQNMSCPYSDKIDKRRAVNEIALINRQTGDVEYGIRSLFTIVGHAFPIFKPLFQFKPFEWLLSKVYRFISFNRRVIMPSSKGHSGDLSDPSFNFRYRIAYLIFTWMITAFILFNYSKLLEGVIPASNFYREFLICGGQIIWQFAIVSAIKKNKTWDYLGTLMTISFAGALLLSVGLVVSCFLSPAPLLFASYFLLVAAFMLLEHIRRSKILELSRIVTFTWVLYRILLLIVILYVQ